MAIQIAADGGTNHDASASLGFLAEFTAATWVRAEDTADPGAVIYNYVSNTGFYIYTTSGNWTVSARDDGGTWTTCTSDAPAAEGVITHVAATRRVDEVLRLFINGVEQADTEAGSLDFQAGNRGLWLGQDRVGTARTSQTIYVASVWNAGLSDAQMLQLYCGGAIVPRMPFSLKPANLVAHYMLDEGAAGVNVGNTSIRDWSGNGNHSVTVDGPPIYRAAEISTLGAGPIMVMTEAEVVAAGGLLVHPGMTGGMAQMTGGIYA